MRHTSLARNKQVRDFAECAERFVYLIDHTDGLSPDQFVRDVSGVLALLYHCALALPDVRSDREEPLEDAIGPQCCADVCGRIERKLAKFDVYWMVFDPYDDSTLVAGSVGDDLAGIYSDVLRRITAFRNGSDADIAEAVWSWRFDFMTHWGRHAVNALAALHTITVDY